MGVKYYTHFLLDQETSQATQAPAEFRGVVEVTRVLPRGDLNAAAKILARNFECDAEDITLLQWSRLH